MKPLLVWYSGDSRYWTPSRHLCQTITELYRISPDVPGLVSCNNQIILDLMLAGF